VEMNAIRQTILDVAGRYPDSMRYIVDGDIERTAFHINLLLSRRGRDIAVCDIGGGVALFSPACAALGMKVTLVDDFSDELNQIVGNDILEIHKHFGVEIISIDVITQNLDFSSGSFDAVTIFDSMEHWHNSPKNLFHELRGWLKPQGLFIVGVPNCVNLRKRITVPLGIGKWSSMESWYDVEVFRGHVREPDVDDLLYIARDLRLDDIEIIGRNWLGYISRYKFARILTPYLDRVLQRFPRLCANIYMLGVKSQSAGDERGDPRQHPRQRSLREAVPRF
jgi:SAM-dependent methyltransferase